MPRAPRAFRGQNGADVPQTPIDVLVDEDVVVFGPMAHFVGGFLHPATHHVFRILGAREQSTLQFFQGWRKDEYTGDVLAGGFLQLLRPLPVDIEEDVPALGQRLPHGRRRRSVAMAEDGGVLEKVSVGYHPVEPSIIDEKVVRALGFSRPRVPRRRRYRHDDGAVGLHEHTRQCRLARPRW